MAKKSKEKNKKILTTETLKETEKQDPMSSENLNDSEVSKEASTEKEGVSKTCQDKYGIEVEI